MSIRERRKRRKRLRINTSKKLEGWKELIVANLRNRLEEEIQRKGRETTLFSTLRKKKEPNMDRGKSISL